MKPVPNRILGYLLVLVSLFIVPYTVLNQRELVNSFFSIEPKIIGFLCFFVFISLVLNGVKIYFLQRIFDTKIRLTESVALASVNALWNYLPFTGGLVARGAYLKKKHGFPWSRFLSVVVASYLISFFAFGLFGFFVTLLLISTKKLLFLLFFAGMILFPIILFYFGRIFEASKLPFLRRFKKDLLGAGELLGNKRVSLQILLLDFVIIAVDSLRIYLVAAFSGKEISLATALLVTPITILASLLNITPGALVIREGIIALTTSQLNYSIETGIIVASLDRLIVMIGIFLAGAWGVFYLKGLLDEN